MVFEYRYYIDHYNDPGYMRVARETHRDMLRLKNIGFDGNMSDQTPRMSMPTSLPMVVEAKTLFDVTTDFDMLADDYFVSAFGSDGTLCRQYLETLSDLFCTHLIRKGGWVPAEDVGTVSVDDPDAHWQNNPYFVQKLSQISKTVDSFMPTIVKNCKCGNVCHRKSWNYLTYHGEIVKELADVFITASNGDLESAQKKFDALVNKISAYELEIDGAFDFFLFNRHFRAKLSMPRIPYYD